MPKLFTAKDVARILCAIDESILQEALRQRQDRCPTTIETLKMYLSILLFILDLIPPIRPLRLAFRILRRVVVRLLKILEVVE